MASKLAIVHKPTKDSKVGIDFIAINGKLYVASLSGLFASTCAEIGDEVVALNNKRVEIDSTTEEDLKDQIKSLESDVALELVTNKPKIFMRAYPDDKEGKNYFICHNSTMPELLKDKKVPVEIWNNIISYTNITLLPKIQVAEKYREGVQLMYDKCMTLGNFEYEFKTETALRMHKAHISACTAHVNASLAASNLLAIAGTMLMPYGIIPQLFIRNEKPFANERKTRRMTEGVLRGKEILILFKETEFSLPIGLEFHHLAEQIL